VSSIVLDSSAALALLLGERGGDKLKAAFLAQGSTISICAVNWSEVLARLQRDSDIVDGDKLRGLLPGVEVVPFGQHEAEQAAELAKRFRSLSLGDRACLALATARNAAAWTADRAWAQMNLGVPLEMLR
jgi:PIN domain nuclease of toxin-antitoxin system